LEGLLSKNLSHHKKKKKRQFTCLTGFATFGSQSASQASNQYLHLNVAYLAYPKSIAGPDSSQDYKLVGGSSAEGQTVIIFRRLLFTVDANDRVITPTDMNIIWYWPIWGYIAFSFLILYLLPLTISLP
jgi:hypothetical protein